MQFTFPILTLTRGGAQRMLAELTNGLVNKGHKVTIIMPKFGEVEYETRATIIRKPNGQLLPSDYPSGDIIVSNYYSTVRAAKVASEQGKGLLVRLSLCYEPTFLEDNHLSFPTYHLTNDLIVLSKWQQEMILLNHGVKGCIVPVGIDSQFRNLHIRKHLQRPLTITAILRNQDSTFSWHRDQLYLVEQLNIVKDRHPSVEINFISPPNEFHESPYLNSLKASNKYQFYTPGNDKELCYHYNQSDIFVSSSMIDAGSLPGLEAMRCGNALVAIYAGGNLDYCRPEQNCLMSYRYENRLATDIERLVTDHTLRSRLAKQGEIDSYNWTWANSVHLFEKEMIKMHTRMKSYR